MLPVSRRRKVVLAVSFAVVAVALAAVLFACSQTPTSVPVRTFERAQRMDVACMALYDQGAGDAGAFPREPVGRRQEECFQTPASLDGNTFQKQLFAFVTQTTRGELAVVNLSAGFLVDQSRATPGVNFLPVGALPTDVATTPDGHMAFVASAEPNKPAIYGIPTRRLLGDTDPRFPHDPQPATIASWPVCALPQNPGALTVVPRRNVPAPAGVDAGATDAGDAGAPGTAADGGASDLPDYELVVVLPGDRLNPAKVLTLDPRPFLRGGLPRLPDGGLDFSADHLANEPPIVGPGPVLEPGSLAPCPITSAIELAGAAAVPTSFAPGPKWDDGVKYVDGGVDLACLRPALAAHCGLRPCCVEDNSNILDGGTDAVAPKLIDGGVDGGNIDLDAGACEPLDAAAAAAADSGTIPLDFGPLDPPRLVSVARDNQMVYVADDGLPLIHVLDLSTPNAPRELAPLLATSQLDPSRVVQVKEIAISPPTREFKRFIYAIDRGDGSIMVYDVTDPATMQRTPLSRPHPELNPFQPPDRIAFSSPAVSVAFARHDLPLDRIGDQQLASSAAGILCNPNHNVDGNPTGDLGFYYRANQPEPGDPIGPRRLRGIFGFATLANGQVLPVDVDDWDAPCRRPADMSFARSDIAPPEPLAGPGDIDPYHEPNSQDAGGDPARAAQIAAIDLAVTNEAFFPMAAPHTLRSEVLINDDPVAGTQIPRLQGAPVVAVNGIILPQLGPGSANTPLLGGPAFATEDPHAHIDQDWAVTYEGAIPGFDGLSGVITSEDNFLSLTVNAPEARFCSKGVEDWALGIERTTEIARTLANRNIALAPRSERLMTDYVQLTEEILPASDPWWTFQTECWAPALDTAAKRQDACVRTFGNAADQSTQRDFPIVEAYDDRVVLGRFFTSADNHREVVYKDPSNAENLKLAKCCFHNQARFHVRTGALWSTIGQTVGGGPGVGFLHHVSAGDGGRCVTSCDPREALLNGRLFTSPPGVGVTLPSQRNSPLAMRNPMFAIWMAGGDLGTPPDRDTQYTFSTRGQFRALFVSVAGGTISVSPQSSRYVEALGQLAVVDGSSQGLVLIDLRAVTVARAPYF
ncbi:MAG: hypothetical protein JWO86_175 [Myxococcaceae bacterium]|nr:hypothetical protein [Myxococcaceae bacterium]